MSPSERKRKAFLSDFKNGSLTESLMEPQEIAGPCQNHSELFTDSKTSHPIPGDWVHSVEIKGSLSPGNQRNLSSIKLPFPFFCQAKRQNFPRGDRTFALSQKTPQDQNSLTKITKGKRHVTA